MYKNVLIIVANCWLGSQMVRALDLWLDGRERREFDSRPPPNNNLRKSFRPTCLCYQAV